MCLLFGHGPHPRAALSPVFQQVGGERQLESRAGAVQPGRRPGRARARQVCPVTLSRMNPPRPDARLSQTLCGSRNSSCPHEAPLLLAAPRVLGQAGRGGVDWRVRRWRGRLRDHLGGGWRRLAAGRPGGRSGVSPVRGPPTGTRPRKPSHRSRARTTGRGWIDLRTMAATPKTRAPGYEASVGAAGQQPVGRPRNPQHKEHTADTPQESAAAHRSPPCVRRLRDDGVPGASGAAAGGGGPGPPNCDVRLFPSRRRALSPTGRSPDDSVRAACQRLSHSARTPGSEKYPEKVISPAPPPDSRYSLSGGIKSRPLTGDEAAVPVRPSGAVALRCGMIPPDAAPVGFSLRFRCGSRVRPSADAAGRLEDNQVTIGADRATLRVAVRLTHGRCRRPRAGGGSDTAPD